MDRTGAGRGGTGGVRVARRRRGFEDTRWRTGAVAAGVLLSVLLPLWRGSGVDGTAVEPSTAGVARSEPRVAGLEPSLWVAILKREGLDGARRRLEALDPTKDAPRPRVGAADLVSEARRQAREGRVRTAVDLGLLAILIDPAGEDAYAAVADACTVLGDGACAAHARRAQALVVGHTTR